MKVDLAQHYRVLGLSGRASSGEIRSAYLDLVKKWHPDVNPSRRAPERFHQINNAYAALADRETQDSEVPPAGGPSRRVRIPLPLACSRCGDAMVEPYQASFTAVRSLLILSWRKETAGVFCPACAHAVGLRASLASGLLGWWSLPGLVLTPLTVFRNALGGKRDEAANLSLLCHNLRAFEAAGDEESARRLAYVLARTPGSVPVKVNMSVASLIATGDNSSGQGRDPKRVRAGDLLLHAAAASAVPVLLATLFLA